MLKHLAAFLILTLTTISCSTIPAPVNERYLTEAGNSEKLILKKIEGKIIDKHGEIKLSEEKSRNISQRVTLLEQESRLLEKENKLKREQLTFYKNKNDELYKEKADELGRNEVLLEFKQNLINLTKTERIYAESEMNLRKAELSKSIAQLYYEKSKIAAAYRDRHEPDVRDKKEQGFIDKYILRKDPDDIYGYKKYEKYYYETIVEFNRAREEYVRAEGEYIIKKKKFDNIK